jgi:hypothetical protein
MKNDLLKNIQDSLAEQEEKSRQYHYEYKLFSKKIDDLLLAYCNSKCKNSSYIKYKNLYIKITNKPEVNLFQSVKFTGIVITYVDEGKPISFDFNQTIKIGYRDFDKIKSIYKEDFENSCKEFVSCTSKLNI